MNNLAWMLALFAVVGLSACSPNVQVDDPISRAPAAVKPTTRSEQKPPAVKTLPQLHTQPRLALRYYDTTRGGIRMYLVAFDDRDHVLRVADQQNGPGTRWTTAQEAAATYGGVAAVNGGFFTPEGKPLGMLIETGTRRGHLNRSSLGAGIYVSSHLRSAILRRESYQKSKSSWNAYNLLQTGPMLVENKQAVTGLSKNNRRPRSFIAWDGKHHWLIGYAEPCTLHALSKAITGRTLGGFEISNALNLDGGRSSDLWAGNAISGGGKSHRGIFNKTVRNYLVLVRRKSVADTE
ncbi:MAG: phosphodiester glycosidase family protein [Akkermansiaceae bacterium]